MPGTRKSVMGGLALSCALLVSWACTSVGQSWYLARCAAGIEKATKAIEVAQDDAERARAYDERGRGYAEKSRYSRAFKLIAADEYERLFGLAIEDHERAIALAPGDAEVYLGRGLTYYHRATLEDQGSPAAKAFYDSAASDFTRAIERDGRNVQALDMSGVVHTSLGDLDRAIADFARVLPIDRHLGKLRLAEAYCERGAAFHRAGNYDAAIADYEASIAYRAGGGGCECQPEIALASIQADRKSSRY